MNNKLKKLVNAIIEIMKEEGLTFLTIRRETFWDSETKKVDHSSDNFTISADWFTDSVKPNE